MVLDDLSTGRIENIAHLLAHPGFTCTSVDGRADDEADA